MNHQKQSLINHLANQGIFLPYTENLQSYQTPLTLYGKTIPNRIGILPLEGFDSDCTGAPTDMVYRRYLRFVRGGAGLIWFEACAVSEDGKSNPYQMALTDENVAAFRKLITLMDQTALKEGRAPAFKVLQLTHSGRMSKDSDWKSIPLAARMTQEEEMLPDTNKVMLADDERIQKMIDEHIHAAKLAADAGFDAVDIKVCHGYFLSELLSAFHRPGPYGGSFENRTRALFEIIDGIQALTKGKIGLAVRLNAFDSQPAPYGYGIVEENGDLKPSLTETIQICQMLRARGVRLINISASSPAVHLFGPEPTDEKCRKYISSADLLYAVKTIKESVPDVIFMCSGLSAFRSLGGEIGAGGIAEHWFDLAGFGRQALAYPDFAANLLNNQALREEKCCVNCDSCFKLMDPGHIHVGCIAKDREVFFPLYQKYVLHS